MRLHLVDGTFELFRAHFSRAPAHEAPDGSDAKATVGLVVSLLALLHDPSEAVSHIAVAFDNPIRSFRNDLFDGYKGDDGVPATLRAQFDAAEAAVRALGVVVWSMREFEADDALATGAARFRDDFDQVRILTPDKDLGQCLEASRVVLVDRMRRREVDEAALLARRGIRPESVPDWLALVGDDADGLPGLPGFGEKTASLLLGRYRHLEDIPASPDEWPGRLRGSVQLAETLARGRADALLFRRLATLSRTVPLRESCDDLRWAGIPRRQFEAWCDAAGTRALLGPLDARPTRWTS
jgi:5'-3' exonuclease